MACRSLIHWIACSSLLLPVATGLVRAAEMEDAGADAPLALRLGLDAAERRLGDAMPIGRGVVMGHVEGQNDRYMPRTDDDRFAGITFKARGGDSEAFSHTTRTAGIIYGPAGLAPGVETVHHFPVPHWLTAGYLRAGQLAPPRADEPRVWSHSWISDGLGDTSDSEDQRRLTHILRRVDYAIDTHGAIMCVGVNNDRSSHVPALLASAYNVIAVGAAEGASSGGYTRLDEPGRCKPELIAPESRTSYATPIVAACAARLVEAATALGETADAPYAARPEVIKALLLAGAVKPWNWRPEPERPLDEHLGAGRVHLDNALRILEAGPQPSDEQAAPMGWSYRQLASQATDAYHFDVDETADEISIVLTWHRRIAGQLGRDVFTGAPRWHDAPRMAHLDLRLRYTDAAGRTGVIARSTSDLDNLQHIHLKDPPPGAYRLEVTRRVDDHDEPWAYAVAWRSAEAR